MLSIIEWPVALLEAGTFFLTAGARSLNLSGQVLAVEISCEHRRVVLIHTADLSLGIDSWFLLFLKGFFEELWEHIRDEIVFPHGNLTDSPLCSEGREEAVWSSLSLLLDLGLMLISNLVLMLWWQMRAALSSFFPAKEHLAPIQGPVPQGSALPQGGQLQPAAQSLGCRESARTFQQRSVKAGIDSVRAASMFPVACVTLLLFPVLHFLRSYSCPPRRYSCRDGCQGNRQLFGTLLSAFVSGLSVASLGRAWIIAVSIVSISFAVAYLMFRHVYPRDYDVANGGQDYREVPLK